MGLPQVTISHVNEYAWPFSLTSSVSCYFSGGGDSFTDASYLLAM